MSPKRNRKPEKPGSRFAESKQVLGRRTSRGRGDAEREARQGKGIDALRTYRLYKQEADYPELINEIRKILLDAMEQRGILTEEGLNRQAEEALKGEQAPGKASRLKEFREALIDYHAANNLLPKELDNYINLARKKEKCRILSVVTNREHPDLEEIYRALRDFCEIPKGEVFISKEEAEGIRVALIKHFISSQLPFISVAKHYLTLRDIDELLQHTIWSRTPPGKLGGKAAGMVLAHKILLPTLEEKDPDLEKYLRVPETWYLGSCIFSEFVERNNLHRLHAYKYKQIDTIRKEYESIEKEFEDASFSSDVVGHFKRILEEIGECPIVIRSSSLLEDSFNLAFSGKYLSLFLCNQGGLDVRLGAFLKAVKRVFASILGPEPILYRQEHGLLDYDERMAMVVQKVVGRRFGRYFFPFAGGVAFSRNVYAWTAKIRKEEGLIRLVFGLGTRAVNRVGSDYPRMIPLSHPQLRPEITAQEVQKYSQKEVDVVELNSGGLETINFRSLKSEIEHPDLFYAVSILKDGQILPPMFKTQDLGKEETCLTFHNLLAKTPFVALMKKILPKIESAYAHPIDVEFAWDQNQLFLLQCRPLSIRKETETVTIPEGIPEDNMFFTTEEGLSNDVVRDIEYLVYVDPRAYDRLQTREEKMKTARILSLLNRRLADKRYALMGPGRWGSNDVNLGVPVGYGDVNKAKVLVEIAFSEGGYTPEVSYGTHFFHDLVESDIVILALFPDRPGTVFRESFLLDAENRLRTVLSEVVDEENVVRLIHVPSARHGELLHVYLNGIQRKGVGYFGTKAGTSV